MKNKLNTSLSLRKVLLSALVAAPLAVLPAPLWAIPQTTNGNVTSNSAATVFNPTLGTNNTGDALTITDNTVQRLVLKWQRFGSTGLLADGVTTSNSVIDGNDVVTFNLAGPTAAVLNMVSLGSTVVDGTLNSNGQIFILNPNGITIGATGVVNATGLGLSTVPDAEFNFLSTGSLSTAGTATNGVVITAGSAITVGSTGTVFVAGQTANIAGTINGGALNVVTQNGAVSLGAGGALTLGGTGDPGYGSVSISSGSGAVNLSANAGGVTLRGSTVSVTTTGAVTAPNALLIGDTNNPATLNINAGTSNITLSNVGGNSNQRLNLGLTGGNVVVTAPGTNTGEIRLNASTINGTLTVNAGGGSIGQGGAVNMVNNSNISLTANALDKDIDFLGSGNLTFTTLVAGGGHGGGSIKVVSQTGSVTLPAVSIATLTVTAAGNITAGAITNRVTNATTPVSVNTSGGITGLPGGAGAFGTALYDPAAAAPTISFTTATGNGAASLPLLVNANGTLSIDTDNDVAGANYAATDTATIAGGTLIAGGTSGSSTFDSTGGSITLDNTGNNFGTLVLKNAPGGVTVLDNGHNLILGNATNVSGAATIASSSTALTAPTAVGDVIFGAAAGNTVRFGSTLTVPAAVNVTDTTNNLTVEGSSTFTVTGAVLLDGNLGNGVGLNSRFGQINVTAAPGGVRVYETTTVNLGTIATAGTLRAYSSAGDITNTGTITAAATQVAAGTAAAPGNITLTNTSNTLGNLTILDDFTILSNTANFAAPGTTIGTILARDLTIASAGSFTLPQLISTAGSGIAGNLTVTTQNAGSGITLGTTGGIVAAGTVTLSAPGAIDVDDAANAFGTVTVTSQGLVDIASSTALTVNATLTGSGNALFEGAGVNIGTFSSDRSTGTVTFTSTGNNPVRDTVNGIRIFGPVNFASGGAVTINRSGHSFGLVGVSTSSNQSATVVESGTMRLGTVLLNNTGSFTATSTTGDILQDAGSSGIRFGNNADGASMTATLSAPLGNILLNDATGTTNRIPRIVATAAGDINVNNTRITTLGNVTAGGTFTLTAGGNAISQLSNARLNVFGTVSITNTGANDITIGNTGNRLGGVVVSSGSGNITLVENTTMNLKSVTTTGTFSATSEAGSIIDSTDSTVANNTVGGTALLGATSFSAPNGNITLGLSGSNYTTVGFTTGGNVSLLDGAGNLTLSASTIGGGLNIISTPSAVVLNQSGVLNVTGDLTVTTNGSTIDFTNAANQLGAIRFTANQVSIAEATTLNLRAGSVATGAVNLSTGANFVTSGAGGSSFTNNLTISAPNGSIIPGAGSLLVVGNFTVFSNVLKDLSALSKSGNLTNKDPINLGSGTYVPPGP